MLIDGEIKRTKENKDLKETFFISKDPRINVHNYGISFNIQTSKGSISFCINRTEMLELLKKKEEDFKKYQEESDKKVNKYYDNIPISWC